MGRRSMLARPERSPAVLRPRALAPRARRAPRVTPCTETSVSRRAAPPRVALLPRLRPMPSSSALHLPAGVEEEGPASREGRSARSPGVKTPGSTLRSPLWGLPLRFRLPSAARAIVRRCGGLCTWSPGFQPRVGVQFPISVLSLSTTETRAGLQNGIATILTQWCYAA